MGGPGRQGHVRHPASGLDGADERGRGPAARPAHRGADLRSRTLLVKANTIQGIPPGLVESTEDVFLTERFDRTRRGHVHAEDLAQVADVAPTFKYESGATYDSLGAVVHALTGEPRYTTSTR